MGKGLVASALTRSQSRRGERVEGTLPLAFALRGDHQLVVGEGEGYVMPIQKKQPPPDTKCLQKCFDKPGSEAVRRWLEIAVETQRGEATLLPGPPTLGPPVSWFYCVWTTAPDDEAVDWYDELDGGRWSIRCVRRFRDGSLKAYSYASPDWRHEMPEAPIPPVEEINDNPEFVAKEISKAEFEVVWERARSNT